MSEQKQYTLEELFDQIITEITEESKSIRAALVNKMSSQTFYRLLEDEVKAKRYTRACEVRADNMAEDMLNISDSVEDDIIVLEDGREVVNNNVIQRDRLRVDTRKWLLAKMNPKKFGDKIDMSSSDGSMTPKVVDLSQLEIPDLIKRLELVQKLDDKK